MTLYINCCPRKESRSDKLAQALLQKLGEYEEIKVYETGLTPYDEEMVNYRNQKIAERDYDDPIFDYAKRFAAADTIVIAAPYWDLSFPAELKIFIENIYAIGLVTDRHEDGRPYGLCKADKLYYVTTAGGPLDPRFGYEYIQTLATNYFGIPDVELIKAEMLDVFGHDPDEIMDKALQDIQNI